MSEGFGQAASDSIWMCWSSQTRFKASVRQQQWLQQFVSFSLFFLLSVISSTGTEAICGSEMVMLEKNKYIQIWSLWLNFWKKNKEGKKGKEAGGKAAYRSFANKSSTPKEKCQVLHKTVVGTIPVTCTPAWKESFLEFQPWKVYRDSSDFITFVKLKIKAASLLRIYDIQQMKNTY